MTTTARLDLSVWRNDDTFEFPLRVRGLDLTSVAMRAQVRLAPDTPGAPLVSLGTVTNANAEGIRLAGVSTVNGVPVSDVRIRINKSSRQSLPYMGEMGDASRLAWAFQIAGRTRIVGAFIVLAHAIDSNAAPLSRPPSYALPGTPAPGPAGGATLTIGADSVAELRIDGVDIASAFADAARDAADTASSASAAALAAVSAVGEARDAVLAASNFFPTRAAGEAGTTVNEFFATRVDGRIAYFIRTASGSDPILPPVGPAIHIPVYDLVDSTGATDVTGAINALLAPYGGTGSTQMQRRVVLEFGDGRYAYKLSGPINVRQYNIHLRADGARLIGLPGCATAVRVYPDNGVNSTHNVAVIGFRLEGSFSGDAIAIEGAPLCIVSEITFGGLTAGGNGIAFYGCAGPITRHNRLTAGTFVNGIAELVHDQSYSAAHVGPNPCVHGMHRENSVYSAGESCYLFVESSSASMDVTNDATNAYGPGVRLTNCVAMIMGPYCEVNGQGMSSEPVDLLIESGSGVVRTRSTDNILIGGDYGGQVVNGAQPINIAVLGADNTIIGHNKVPGRIRLASGAVGTEVSRQAANPLIEDQGQFSKIEEIGKIRWRHVGADRLVIDAFADGGPRIYSADASIRFVGTLSATLP